MQIAFSKTGEVRTDSYQATQSLKARKLTNAETPETPKLAPKQKATPQRHVVS